MTRILPLASKVFLFCVALFFSTATVNAASFTAQVTVSISGACGQGGSPTCFSATLVADPGEFPAHDYLVDFGGGYTEWRDSHVFYVVDPAGKIIGRYHEGLANIGHYNQMFFTINAQLTAAGNVTVHLV